MSDNEGTRADMIWGVLLHLSYNMWWDREPGEGGLEYIAAKPYLRFDETLWNDLLARAAGAGLNMMVLDLGDGVRYDSHPEIAVEGAWPTDKLRAEVRKLRDMGLEPIPKLNFSASHDVWLGEYARCVSTERYYRVCRDLIAEICELFDGPRLFHLGMDEETAHHQQGYEYVVIRQHDLWWHDLRFLLDQVEACGARPWVWSDYEWQHQDTFYQRMPHSVLQSNWYYGIDFGPDVVDPQAYVRLEEHAYDQLPTGSNWDLAENMEATVRFCRERIAPERLIGFLTAPWKPTLEACRGRHEAAIDLMARAKALYEGA